MSVPDELFVIMDKRDTILEKGDLQPTSVEKGACVPLFTVWKSRSAAEHQCGAIKDRMSLKVWKTWQFRAVEYKRAP